MSDRKFGSPPPRPPHSPSGYSSYVLPSPPSSPHFVPHPPTSPPPSSPSPPLSPTSHPPSSIPQSSSFPLSVPASPSGTPSSPRKEDGKKEDVKGRPREDSDEEDFPETKDKPKPTGQIKFDLFIALKTLSQDKPELIQQLEEDEAKVRTLRANIVNAARKNHILERELQELDDKIKLLIKNRITVQEVIAQSAGLISAEDKSSTTGTASDSTGLHVKRQCYEDFLYLLQSKPRYLARLAKYVQGSQIALFVQTVVFDLFGDQYDTREERLLLSLFRLILEDELASATEKGSLLRANTAVTQMLSAYARRGQGLSILKDILLDPLKKLTSQKELNLEINPMKVYSQMIQDYETETGKTSDLPRDVDDETAAKHPDVQKIIAARSILLQDHADLILKRIMDAVDSVPYGMRWICKQLGDLSRKRFPDIDRHQVGSLMGGYIYLRFFNPVIVTPDALNFINGKPSRIVRRNLVLIAKVLQNLSNGLTFGDKEIYMKPLNEYIQSKMEPLQVYFNKLTKVDELGDALQVDKYLEHTSAHTNVLQVSINQIYLLHDLVFKNIDKIAPDPDDRMRESLSGLGKPPAPVSKEANRTITLQLSERRSKRDMSTAADAFLAPRVNPLLLQAKKLLLSVLRRLPDTPGSQTNILGFLEEQKQVAKEKSATELVESLTNVISMLKTLLSMNLLEKESTADETFNIFLWGFVQESLNRRTRILTTTKRLKMIENAMAAIQEHHKHLVSRLELYKMYLDNVRKGVSINEPTLPSSKKKAPKASGVHKFSHKQLEEMGVVAQTSAVVRGAVLKKVYYAFSMVSPGRFKVELILKKGVDVKLLKQPITLNLEDLLQMQEKGNSYMDVDYVTLNVNLLIHLLNKRFLAKSS